jgi:hypothetical protein
MDLIPPMIRYSIGSEIVSDPCYSPWPRVVADIFGAILAIRNPFANCVAS